MAKARTSKRKSPLKEASSNAGAPAYPSHDAELESLARIEGQVRGIQKMIKDGRYCVDILVQLRAVHAAVRRVERNILRSYMQTCVQRAFRGPSAEEREQKIAELLQLFELEPFQSS